MAHMTTSLGSPLKSRVVVKPPMVSGDVEVATEVMTKPAEEMATCIKRYQKKMIYSSQYA